MKRRIVCFLLVPALLANQAAMCCAHTHRSSEANDHSTRTHFHISGEGHGASGNDHHHSNCIEHVHSNASAAHDMESVSDLESGCHVSHDSAAIFFGEQNVFQLQSTRLTIEDQPLTSKCVFAETSIVKVKKHPNQVQITCAGRFLPYRCAIYLQTHCLLI